MFQEGLQKEMGNRTKIKEVIDSYRKHAILIVIHVITLRLLDFYKLINWVGQNSFIGECRLLMNDNKRRLHDEKGSE